jgi:hypothetical protein
VTLLKRTILALSLIIIIVLSVATWFIHNQLQKPLNPSLNVKITSFAVDDQWNYLGGVTFDCRFNITLENRGLDDIAGLVLKVKVFNNNTELNVGNYFAETYENGTIKETLGAGEVRVFEGTLLSNPPLPEIRTNNVVAAVLLDNAVLDEQTNQ